MKTLNKIMAIGLLSAFATLSNAATLDFNDSANLGVSLGGDMRWNSTGGGHLYNEGYYSNDYIYFSSATTVNSFEMNAMPWENYGGGNIGLIDINGLDSSSNVIWSATVDLTNYTDWSTWYTVDVNTVGISTLEFIAPGNDPHNNGFWPSVDNMVINESVSAVPEPSTYALMLGGLGLVGFMAARRRKQA